MKTIRSTALLRSLSNVAVFACLAAGLWLLTGGPGEAQAKIGKVLNSGGSGTFQLVGFGSFSVSKKQIARIGVTNLCRSAAQIQLELFDSNGSLIGEPVEAVIAERESFMHDVSPKGLSLVPLNFAQMKFSCLGGKQIPPAASLQILDSGSGPGDEALQAYSSAGTPLGWWLDCSQGKNLRCPSATVLGPFTVGAGQIGRIGVTNRCSSAAQIQLGLFDSNGSLIGKPVEAIIAERASFMHEIPPTDPWLSISLNFEEIKIRCLGGPPIPPAASLQIVDAATGGTVALVHAWDKPAQRQPQD